MIEMMISATNNGSNIARRIGIAISHIDSLVPVYMANADTLGKIPTNNSAMILGVAKNVTSTNLAGKIINNQPTICTRYELIIIFRLNFPIHHPNNPLFFFLASFFAEASTTRAFASITFSFDLPTALFQIASRTGGIDRTQRTPDATARNPRAIQLTSFFIDDNYFSSLLSSFSFTSSNSASFAVSSCFSSVFCALSPDSCVPDAACSCW